MDKSKKPKHGAAPVGASPVFPVVVPAANPAFLVSEADAEPKGIPYDPVRGRAAFDALWPVVEGLGDDALAGRGLDLQAAGLSALRVGAFVTSPALGARFELVSPKLFDHALLAALPDAAMAVLYAYDEAARVGAFTSQAQVPAAVVESAVQVEGRMQRVCDYLLGDDPVEGPVVLALRPGTGHRDLANDLLGYAGLYDRNPETVAADPKHYQPTDLAKAREHAGAILAALASGQSPEARQWSGKVARVWTYLDAMYREVASTGRWLLRADPHGAERFPSLYAGARLGHSRAKAGTKGGAPTPPAGGVSGAGPA